MYNKNKVRLAYSPKEEHKTTFRQDAKTTSNNELVIVFLEYNYRIMSTKAETFAQNVV